MNVWYAQEKNILVLKAQGLQTVSFLMSDIFTTEEFAELRLRSGIGGKESARDMRRLASSVRKKLERRLVIEEPGVISLELGDPASARFRPAEVFTGRSARPTHKTEEDLGYTYETQNTCEGGTAYPSLPGRADALLEETLYIRVALPSAGIPGPKEPK